jgi:hypothetical protein
MEGGVMNPHHAPIREVERVLKLTAIPIRASRVARTAVM